MRELLQVPKLLDSSEVFSERFLLFQHSVQRDTFLPLIKKSFSKVKCWLDQHPSSLSLNICFMTTFWIKICTYLFLFWKSSCRFSTLCRSKTYFSYRSLQKVRSVAVFGSGLCVCVLTKYLTRLIWTKMTKNNVLDACMHLINFWSHPCSRWLLKPTLQTLS